MTQTGANDEDLEDDERPTLKMPLSIPTERLLEEVLGGHYRSHVVVVHDDDELALERCEPVDELRARAW